MKKKISVIVIICLSILFVVLFKKYNNPLKTIDSSKIIAITYKEENTENELRYKCTDLDINNEIVEYLSELELKKVKATSISYNNIDSYSYALLTIVLDENNSYSYIHIRDIMLEDCKSMSINSQKRWFNSGSFKVRKESIDIKYIRELLKNNKSQN